MAAKIMSNIATKSNAPPGRHSEFTKADLLTMLTEGQQATVLQLPAAPKTGDERENQERAAYVG
jgi:hypothetical protein